MLFSSTLFFIAITALTSSLVTAQNYSTSGPLTITVSQVPLVLRQTWCSAQLHSCPQICGGPTTENNCDADTLDYTCTCADNSNHNISAYINTVPFFICQQWIINCVDNHPNDLSGIAGCHSVTCGSKNSSAGAGAASASASGSAPAKTGGGSGGGSGGGMKSSSSSGVAAAATMIAQNYGTQILAGGMLAVFGMAL